MDFQQDFKQILDLQNDLIHLRLQFWLEHDLFKPHWWFFLATSILPWIIWWKIADKRRFKELLIYGLLWAIFAMVFDELGVSLRFWYYPKELFSMVSPLFPADLTIIPIAFMVIYQFFPKRKHFFWGTTIASAVFSFIVQPLFIYFHFFWSENWEHVYSFPLFILLAYFLRWIVRKIETKSAV